MLANIMLEAGVVFAVTGVFLVLFVVAGVRAITNRS